MTYGKHYWCVWAVRGLYNTEDAQINTKLYVSFIDYKTLHCILLVCYWIKHLKINSHSLRTWMSISRRTQRPLLRGWGLGPGEQGDPGNSRCQSTSLLFPPSPWQPYSRWCSLPLPQKTVWTEMGEGDVIGLGFNLFALSVMHILKSMFLHSH